MYHNNNNIRDTQQKLTVTNAAIDGKFVKLVMLAGLIEQFNQIVMVFKHSGAIDSIA